MDQAFTSRAKLRLLAFARPLACGLAKGGMALCGVGICVGGMTASAATTMASRPVAPAGFFQPTGTGQPGDGIHQNWPPALDEAAGQGVNAGGTPRPALPLPGLLARTPRKGKSTPTPTPSPTDGDSSPAATANQGGASTPATAPSPAPSPTMEFMEKYEAAFIKFTEKNYPDALALLDEADKIQPGQPQSASLRFKARYSLAYNEYRRQNYPEALAQLDEADRAQKNADSYNLRGLIFSKQHLYDQAEAMFRKAVATDPALWAAKFNYAELPFNRGNYVDARTRFEELYSQTDAAKQPREGELTQYKVFLTLLLDGKVEQANSFMDHLNFSGATPARYFCNAALNFRAGNIDKARNWIDDAKKEYPPQLVAIFVESFYRLGWMTDPNTVTAVAVAQTTPPAATGPSASPGPAAEASAAGTPMVMAAASPTPTPVSAQAPATASALASASTPVPKPSVTPVPSVAPAPAALPIAKSTPTATAAAPTATPALAVVAPTAVPKSSPVATFASAAPSSTPALASATAPPAAQPTATASSSPLVTSAPAVASTAATPVPSSSASVTVASKGARPHRNLIRAVVIIFGLLETAFFLFRTMQLLAQRQAETARRIARKRPLVSSPK